MKNKRVVSVIIRDYEDAKRILIGVFDAEQAVQNGKRAWEDRVWRIAAHYGSNLGVQLVVEQLDGFGNYAEASETVDLAPEYRELLDDDPPCDVCGKTLEAHASDVPQDFCYTREKSQEREYREFLDANKSY